MDIVFYGCQLKLIICSDLDTYLRGSLKFPTMIVNLQFCQFMYYKDYELLYLVGSTYYYQMSFFISRHASYLKVCFV